MNEIFQRAVKRNEEMRKPLSTVPWKLDEPHPQPYYVFDDAKQDWVETHPQPQPQDPAAAAKPGDGSPPPITRLALYSWNIDFMLPHARARMEAALAHLETLASPHLAPASSTGVVIFLQECVAEDLAAVGAAAWVRARFAATDRGAGENWASGVYGTTTLVDRRLLPLAACFRVHYAQTRMERDALFVDVLLHSAGDSNNDREGKGGEKLIRLCNTHLESLANSPALRPPQMRLAASFMRGERQGPPGSSPGPVIPHGALAAGDFNAVQDFDRALHSDNGLRDAYLEAGGAEDSEGGYTWGQQAATELREFYGCSRMDKVYLSPGGLRLLRFARFGAGVELEDPARREELCALGFDEPWITDHLGVMAEVEVVD